MFNVFPLYRKDEILLKTRSTPVAVFGNKVECCFDIVAGVDGALDGISSNNGDEWR